MAIQFDASGSASTTAAITALTTATSVYGKSMRDVSYLLNMVGNQVGTVISCDDNVSVAKYEVYLVMGGSVGGSNTFQLTAGGAGVAAATTFPSFNQLPSSGPIIFCYFFTNATFGVALFNAAGTLLASTTRSGGVLNNATGFLRINKPPIANAHGAIAACISEGDAVYTTTPFDTTFSSSSWTTAPGAGDTNIVAMYKENDAFAGTSPSTIAAQVGSQAMTPTASHFNWSQGAGAQWFGPPAVAPPRQPMLYGMSQAIVRASRW